MEKTFKRSPGSSNWEKKKRTVQNKGSDAGIYAQYSEGAERTKWKSRNLSINE